MAIADKLKKLNDTKNALKTVANNHGGEISAETPFSEYSGVFDGVIRKKETALTETETELTKVQEKLSAKMEQYAKFIGKQTYELTEDFFDGVEKIRTYLAHSDNVIKKITVGGTVRSIEQRAFYNMTALEEIYIPSTVKDIQGQYFLANCSKLHTAYIYRPYENTDRVEAPLNQTPALKNLVWTNIRKPLQVASGTTWGHLLTLDSLIGLCRECIDTGTFLTLTVGSANLEKLENVYVRLIEDDGSGKLPFEVCESTDEGAVKIKQYMIAKNWDMQ